MSHAYWSFKGFKAVMIEYNLNASPMTLNIFRVYTLVASHYISKHITNFTELNAPCVPMEQRRFSSFFKRLRIQRCEH